MVVKKTSKKVTKKKVTKVSRNNLATMAMQPIDTDLLFEGIGSGFNDAERKIFLEAILHYQKARLKSENGEFRGDLTRDTFDSCNNFSKVLMQQGRVQLDADWNEQVSISTHNLRNLACHVGSEHWGPLNGSGFALATVDDLKLGILISPGYYYVNGIMCEVGLDNNEKFISYMTQPDYPITLEEQTTAEELVSAIESGQHALVYLDVWERHYTYVNDDSMREAALAGPDTATRAKIIWQVKVLLMDPPDFDTSKGHPFKLNYQSFLEAIGEIIKPGKGKLCAKVKDKSGDDNDPCLIVPDSRYRGNENQLYRVEIHNSGIAEGYTENSHLSNATFKWSRENASVFFPITDIQSNLINLEHLGKDCRYGLKPNDWVEIIDDDSVFQCRADKLLQVESIDTENRTVTLKAAPEKITLFDESKHPYLRRWDHTDGDENGIAVVAKSDGEMWLDLEDGIQVQFKGIKEDVLIDPSDGIEIPDVYKTGDYWLIPARTITGDIEWPRDKEGNSICISAQGVIHHYAPLALFDGGAGLDDNGEPVNLRRILKQAWK